MLFTNGNGKVVEYLGNLPLIVGALCGQVRGIAIQDVCILLSIKVADKCGKE